MRTRGGHSLDSRDFLKTMVEATGVSGHEAPVAALIKEAFLAIADDVRIDVMGNVVAQKKGEGEGDISIMLAAHMDEIGLMVTKIDERGFLKFIAIGGIDQRTLVAQEVKVHGNNCLLYTSPSPRDGATSRMPSSA